MPKSKPLQTNFSAGEVDPDLGMRQDTEQYQNGAKSLHNRRCLVTGGTVRRPGTVRQATGYNAVPRRWVVNAATQYVAVFSSGRVDFYSRNTTTGDLTAAGSLTSCPWGSDFRNLVVAQTANTMFVTLGGMATQVLTRTGASTWSRSAFTYTNGPGAVPKMPFIKFAGARTLTPSGLTGSITLTISGSDAWFTANHVGQYIRYVKRACLITAVAGNGLSCTATVLQNLPQTQRITVGSTANFQVGEVVESSANGAKGIVTGIPSSTTIDVVLSEGLTAFTGSGNLVGPNDLSAISGVASATAAAVTDWDEQMFGPVFGYPSCVVLHRNRIIFGGHDTLGDYLVASELGDFYAFDVGDGSDGDAIIESIGDSAAARIVQMYSAEQLVVATDTGLYYVPETPSAPFRPSSMAFYPFGDRYEISAGVQPHGFDGGVVFAAGSLILVARPTGDTQQAWRADEVSLISPHLFKTPTDLTTVSSFAGGVERYAVFRNTDGTLAVMQLISEQKIRNVTPWETDIDTDTFDGVTAIEGDLYVTATRQINGATAYTLERFDQNVTLDYATEFASLASVTGVYGSTTVNVVTESGFHLGTYPLTLDATPDGPYTVGLLYGSEIETLPPVIDDNEGSRAGDKMRIYKAQVFVRSSARFAANGYELIAYQTSDDTSEPPPLKEGPQEFTFLGWRTSPTIVITQTDPLPLKVLAIRQEVAY